MHRVYFDENEQVSEGFALWLPTSKDDLARIGAELQEGLRVVLYWTGESEIEAVLKFDAKWDTWVGIGDYSTYNDAEGRAAYEAWKAANAKGS
jgi:hypothetical protein